MSEIDTSAEAVERLARAADQEARHEDAARGAGDAQHADYCKDQRILAATLRALVAERDAALREIEADAQAMLAAQQAISKAGEALQVAFDTGKHLQADRDRLAARVKELEGAQKPLRAALNDAVSYIDSRQETGAVGDEIVADARADLAGGGARAMTADDLVERVARAIWSPEPGVDWDYESVSDETKAMLRAEARAAIRAVHEAMREPSAEDWARVEERCRAMPGSLWARQARIHWEEVLAAHPIAEAARDE